VYLGRRAWPDPGEELPPLPPAAPTAMPQNPATARDEAAD
jgi:hypothetical protein